MTHDFDSLFDSNQLFIRAHRPETPPIRDMATRGWKSQEPPTEPPASPNIIFLNQISFLREKNCNIWFKSVVCKGATPRNAPDKRLANTWLMTCYEEPPTEHPTILATSWTHQIGDSFLTGGDLTEHFTIANREISREMFAFEKIKK